MIRTKFHHAIKKASKKKSISKPKKKIIPDKKRGRGAPSKWKPEYVELAFNYCKLGAIEEDLAAFFDVTIDCITKWKKKYPDLLLSIRKGRRVSDNEIVKSMYHRAKGYSHPETKAQWVDSYVFDPDTQKYVKVGRWEYAELTKHYPPDASSMIFWLKNRQRNDWKDKWEDDEGDNTPLESRKIVFEVKSARKDKKKK